MSAPKEDEPTHDEKNIQLNVASQSYGEHFVTNDIDNIQKERDMEIAKAQKILMQTVEVMNKKPLKSKQGDATSMDNPSRCVARQQSHTARAWQRELGASLPHASYLQDASNKLNALSINTSDHVIVG